MPSDSDSQLAEFSSLSQFTVEDPALRMRLVGQSWRNNLEAGVTGVLRLRESCLEQLIEGPSDVIVRLATGILTDRRHGWITIRAFGPIAARKYLGWSFEGFDSSQVILKEAPAMGGNLHVLPEQDDAPARRAGAATRLRAAAMSAAACALTIPPPRGL